MENAFDQMRDAVARAKQVNEAVDSQVNALVDLLSGRLERVAPWKLARLKIALQRFNARTGEWKD
jgi:hypothetical protein